MAYVIPVMQSKLYVIMLHARVKCCQFFTQMLGSLQIQDLTRSAEHRQLLLAVIWDQVQTTLTCIDQLGLIFCYMAMDLN